MVAGAATAEPAAAITVDMAAILKSTETGNVQTGTRIATETRITKEESRVMNSLTQLADDGFELRLGNI